MYGLNSVQFGDSSLEFYDPAGDHDFTMDDVGNFWADNAIKADYKIIAGNDVQAGGSIEAAVNIKAVGDLFLDDDVFVGDYIEAGGSIQSKWDITVAKNIFSNYIFI